jgi:hypothetical protein
VGAAFSRELKRSRLEAAPTKSNTACSFQITELFFNRLIYSKKILTDKKSISKLQKNSMQNLPQKYMANYSKFGLK